MPTFDWAESPGSSCELEPSITEVRYGDGYIGMADAGLNPVRQVWSLVFSAVDSANADLIAAFLKPGLGRAVFDWTPPRHTTALKFRCTQFSRTLTDVVGVEDLRARFEQLHQP